MANTARFGNAAELRVAHHLEQQMWLVASLRHVGGPGDLLAIHPRHRTRLIEVKGNQAGGPYMNFRRPDREAMWKAAKLYDLDILLAYSPSPDVIQWLASDQWPSALPDGGALRGCGEES